MSWQAANWAVTAAPLPKSDPAARAVLAYLGVKADDKGRNAYPLALSIAHDCTLNPEVVPRVLKRLVDYGLISKDGVGPQGQPRWVLHMDRCHAVGSFDEFARRHQSGRTLRQSRWRSKADVDDAGSSTSTSGDDSESSTRDDASSSTPPSETTPDRLVDDDGSSLRRLSIVSVDDSEYPQINPLDQSTSVLDQNPGAAAPAPPEKRDLNAGRDDVDRLCRHLADRIEGNGSRRPTVTKTWRDAARLLLDRDGRTEQQVHNAIDWCQDDSFWHSNVLSMPTLRAQYDRLRLQAQRGSTPAKRTSTTDQRVEAAQALKARYANDPRNQPERRQLPGGRPA